MTFTTNYPYPWALVRWGGAQPGNRPSVRLAFITEAVGWPSGVTAFRLHTLSGASGYWTKMPCTYGVGEIVRTWRNRPSVGAIRLAKKNLTKEG